VADLKRGMVVLEAVKSPLRDSPAKILYAGLGKGNESGKTLFDVFIDGMYYGYFMLNGEITTLEEAQRRLLAPLKIDGEEETVAEQAVRYRWVHVDDNDAYAYGD